MSFYRTLLEPTMTEATSLPFTLGQDVTFATLICNGLADDETATIQIYDPIAEEYIDWSPAASSSGDFLLLSGNGTTQLTADVNSITVGPVWGTFQIVKSETVAEVGISCAQFVSNNGLRSQGV